jgi:hypothetical protein
VAVERERAPWRERWLAPSLATGQLLAWALLAIINAAAIAWRIPMPIGGRAVRVLHHLYDAGQLLAAGVLSFIAVAVWQKWGPRRATWGYLALYAAALVVGAFALSEDVGVLSGKLARKISWLLPWQALLVAAAATWVPLSAAAGRLLSRGYRKALAAPVFLAFALGNHLVLPNDYPGVHFFLAWGAAALCGTAIAHGGQRPRYAVIPQLMRLVVAGLAAWALIAPPTNRVSLELYRSSASVVAPLLARLRANEDRAVSWKRSSNPWFNPRDGLPPVAPTRPSLVTERPIVIFLTVDCLRADVAMREEHVARLPAIQALKAESVVFTHARTPAPGTTVALASIFTSRYFAQLYWSPTNEKYPDTVYAHADTTEQFTEILTRAGVRTFNIQGMPGITATYGVRGMEDVLLPSPQPGHYAGVQEQVPVLLERVQKHANESLFLYAHFGDPHDPYISGGTDGPPFERYLKEIELVDRGLGALFDGLKRASLWSRTTIILSSDHGEAFGEHGQKYHATTLYEELLRVPLIVRVPGVKPRVVGEPVSLIDIAPTVLDLFGRPTPGIYMGQSLVPILRANRRLSRPLAFESGRHMRAMVFPDRIKVIEDRRKQTVELYDLERDPGELYNRYDAFGVAGSERVEELRRFFAAHELKREGYKLPYAR